MKTLAFIGNVGFLGYLIYWIFNSYIGDTWWMFGAFITLCFFNMYFTFPERLKALVKLWKERHSQVAP